MILHKYPSSLARSGFFFFFSSTKELLKVSPAASLAARAPWKKKKIFLARARLDVLGTEIRLDPPLGRSGAPVTAGVPSGAQQPGLVEECVGAGRMADEV